MEKESEAKIAELIKKVTEGKKGQLDLSSDEDLSIAVMNLISIEEHFFFTGAKTGKPEYYDLLSRTREMRKELLKKLIKDYEGEVWCISKHLLSASMRLMEVGTKQMGLGNKNEAEDLFSKAYELYSLFWGINLGITNIGEVKKIPDDALSVGIEKGIAGNPSDPEPDESRTKEKKTAFGSLGEIVKKIIDCCVE